MHINTSCSCNFYAFKRWKALNSVIYGHKWIVVLYAISASYRPLFQLKERSRLARLGYVGSRSRASCHSSSKLSLQLSYRGQHILFCVQLFICSQWKYPKAKECWFLVVMVVSVCVSRCVNMWSQLHQRLPSNHSIHLPDSQQRRIVGECYQFFT